MCCNLPLWETRHEAIRGKAHPGDLLDPLAAGLVTWRSWASGGDLKPTAEDVCRWLVTELRLDEGSLRLKVKW